MSSRIYALLSLAALSLLPIVVLAQHGGMGGGGSTGGGSMGSGAPTTMQSGSATMGRMGSDMGSGAGMSARSERRMHAETLLRAHGDVLALDPRGNLIKRDEIVGLGVSAQGLAAVRAAGFDVRVTPSAGLEAGLVVLRTPPGMSARKALKQVRALDVDASFDFNHIYYASGGNPATSAVTAPGVQNGLSSPSRRIGLIDGGPDAGHPALRAARIHGHGCDGRVVLSSHGTAIASRIIAGFSDAGSPMPQVDLYAADVYCGELTGGSVEAIVRALSWLIEEKVPVINVSLVGPSNALLERAIGSSISSGHLIVAAIGNDGPSAPALYPAAYPGVIAVTAVDQAGKVLMEAGRGKFLSFAAPGADIEAAALPSGFTTVRGTSFAAPIVASHLALLVRRPDRSAAERAVAELAATALDLGSPGRDPVYGIGCIGCSNPAHAQRVSR